VDDRDWSRWLVQAHHPDWMRVPEPSPGRICEDRARAALTWNAFRTLALIQPSFWLRQLHARMFGFDERYKAPASLDVRIWEPAVPGAGADRRTGVVDVVLESPDAVWGFLTVFGRDVIVTRDDTHGPDPLRRTVDAVAGIAGRRRSFVGLIASSERTAPIGTRLVRGHAADLRQGCLSAGREGHHVLGIGLGTWATLATVIASAAGARAIDRPERLALRRCLRWLAAAGIRPDDRPALEAIADGLSLPPALVSDKYWIHSNC
jgi:hypothetical protein